MKAGLLAQRLFWLGLIVEVVAIPIGRLIPGAIRIADVGTVVGVVIFLMGVLAGITDTRRQGGRITVYPHGVLLLAWTTALVAFVVLVFGQGESRPMRTGLQVVTAVAVIVGAVAYFSAWSRSSQARRASTTTRR